MHKRLLPIALIGTFFLFIINWSCTKLDTTTLGSDLIPAVDNIHTFADTISINSTQGSINDTTQVLPTENQALGRINNDPLFGTTEANIFFQAKPASYPFQFGNVGDTLVGVDSIVLCLSYKGSWGDSLLPQQLQVSEIVDANFRDSVNKRRDVNYQPTLGAVLGTGTIYPQSLADTVFFANHKDSSTDQIRIKLTNTTFINKLFSQSGDSTSFNNAFYNDSLFRRAFNGFAVKAVGTTSNSLMYISLSDVTTRLEVHFRKKDAGTGTLDTVYNSLSVSPGDGFSIAPSGSANNIIRNRTAIANTGTATEHYLQTAPGTFINLSMSGLTGMPNRIIHRAYISIQQIPTDPVYDGIFTAPPYLYLDLKDTNTVTPLWKPIYYDLTQTAPYDPDNKNGYPYFPAAVDNSTFGGVAKIKSTSTGPVNYYEFNITRYIQQLVTKQTHNYDMRLWPAYNIVYPQYGVTEFPYGNPVAYGRVKIGSGSNPDPNYKMRLIIIYSKPQ